MKDGAVIAEVHESQIERLTRQFYAWERRGRGWQVWPEPVELEPPFAPFRFHWVPPRAHVLDDGRRPTVLSRLADRLIQALSDGQSEARTNLPVLDLEDVKPEQDRGGGELAELRLSLPPEAVVTSEAAEQFLLSLPRSSRPTCFEILGTPEAITVQLACAREGQASLSSHLKAYFPESVVSAEPGRLEGIWQETRGEAVIVEFGLADEFMLPLRVLKRLSVDPLTGIGAALSDLEAGEAGVLQVLLQPVRHPWAQSILRAVLASM